MSSQKRLTCGFCHVTVFVQEVKFPEDLYDLMKKYNVEQLVWLCRKCKLLKDEVNGLNVKRELQDIKAELSRLTSSTTALNVNGNAQAMGASPSSISLDMSERYSLFSLESYARSQSSVSSSASSNSIAVMKDVISTDIKIDPALKKQNKEIIEDFREKILIKMKQTDDLFNDLFQKTYPTGSSYEGLRITDPNEFDIDVLLKFPFRSDLRSIDPVQKKSCFAAFRLVDGWDRVDINNLHLVKNIAMIKQRFVEHNYIMPAEIRRWLQSIIDKVNVSAITVKHVARIFVSQSGPAKTFKLHAVFNNKMYEISIDLVPVIEFSINEAPNGFDKGVIQRFNVPAHLLFWFMVPKEYSGSHCDPNSAIAKRLWRLHFPGIEKHIIHNRGCVKPIIKLLKLLRDKQNWAILSSYSLKTVVLTKVIPNPSHDYWHDANVKERLLEVMHHLSACLALKNIPHVFFCDNLLQNVNPSSIDNVHFRLKRIILHLEADFNYRFPEYFKVENM